MEATASSHAALRDRYDITTLTRPQLAAYAELTQDAALGALATDDRRLAEFMEGRQVIDLLEAAPHRLTGSQLTRLAAPAAAATLSVASSRKATPDEAHLLVAAVEYDSSRPAAQGRGIARRRRAAHARATRLKIYLKPNPHFRLPADQDRPVIMVGPGTGVAPFRAFMQERDATGARGRNWLFFGGRNFTHDFLYQLEWQDLLKSGVLTRLDVAFSRDQRREDLRAASDVGARRDLFGWLRDGARALCLRRRAGDGEGRACHAAADRGGSGRHDAGGGRGLARRVASRRALSARRLLSAKSSDMTKHPARPLSRNEDDQGGEPLPARHARGRPGTRGDRRVVRGRHAAHEIPRHLPAGRPRSAAGARARRRWRRRSSSWPGCASPAACCTPAQWLALDAVARERGNGTIRLTTRETFQFHGIIKSNLRRAIQAINGALLDTVAACGDVNRNVIASTIPYRPAAHGAAVALAREVSAHLRPRTRAYHEIWLDGEKVAGGEEEDEPIYGRAYLPRKFKIAIAVPPLNDVDVFAHDLGFIAIVENGKIVGYNVAVGGGMGMTHGEPDTFPRTGDVIGFCRPEQVVEFAEKVVVVQRDWGNRASRKHARLKYTIEESGLDWFRPELDDAWAIALEPAAAVPVRAHPATGSAGSRARTACGTHLVRRERPRKRRAWPTAAAAALREIAEVHRRRSSPSPPNQNLIISDVTPERDAGDRRRFWRNTALDDAASGAEAQRDGLRRAADLRPRAGRERALPARPADGAGGRAGDGTGSRDDEITIRMTGCPNGCARPYLAEIGLVGRGPGTYNLYLGGAFDGTRLNKLYAGIVKHAGIIATLSPLLAAYARERAAGERFSDFLIRADHVSRPRPAIASTPTWRRGWSTGSRSRTRTYDPAVNSRLLYQLSYPGSAGAPYSEAPAAVQTASCGRYPTGEAAGILYCRWRGESGGTVDAVDLKSTDASLVGSNPSSRTNPAASV